MTKAAYHRDCLLTELSTEVIDVGEEDGRPFAVVADTIFYPEGGGQPADHGTLGESRVLDVRKTGEEIRHYLSHTAVEGPVRLELDWPRRWDHMQQHSAQHVLAPIGVSFLTPPSVTGNSES